MNFSVRPLEKGDLSAAAALEKDCFSAPWSEKTLEAELQNPLNRFFAAVSEDGELLGYAGIQIVAGEGSVFNVAVKKEARRQGIGGELVHELLAAAKEQKTETVYLEVRASNLAAISLYEKAGFVFCGLRKNYYTDPVEHALLMKAVLIGEAEHEDPIECWDEE